MNITRDDILDLKRKGKGFEAMQKLREYQSGSLRSIKMKAKAKITSKDGREEIYEVGKYLDMADED